MISYLSDLNTTDVFNKLSIPIKKNSVVEPTLGGFVFNTSSEVSLEFVRRQIPQNWDVEKLKTDPLDEHRFYVITRDPDEVELRNFLCLRSD